MMTDEFLAAPRVVWKDPGARVAHRVKVVEGETTVMYCGDRYWTRQLGPAPDGLDIHERCVEPKDWTKDLTK